MVSIAKKAVERIKILSQEGRTLASWIESNPKKYFRRPNCPKVGDNEVLTNEQIFQALGWSFNPKSARQVLKNNGLEAPQTLNSLWQFVMHSQRQPPDLHWLSKSKKIKYTEALFCMTVDIFGSKQSPHYPILWAPTNNDFNNDLNPSRLGEGKYETIFDRHGYKSGGERIKLTSHQARHLLNTIAQRGGLSNLEIAKWSGRADVKQNATYNHMSEFEMVARAEELDTGLSLFGPIGEPSKHSPISIQEFNTLEKGAMHVTEFGICVHDYTLSPCEKFRDCLNCSEQVCIKTKDERYDRIRAELSEVESQYLKASQAMIDGLAGADRWYEYHSNKLKRLKGLIDIFEDQDISEGALIKLRNQNEFSIINRAITSKLNLRNPNSELLENLSDLLGGGLG